MLTLVSSIAQTQPKKWTVLLYSAADNNLHPYMVDDVAELETVGSDAQTDLLVQVDHGREGVGAERLKLEKFARPQQENPNPHGPIQSPVLENLGQVNMSSAYTLANSIEWAMKNYPSEHFMLIISDHGNAWKGCAQDDSARGWMNVPELKAGLAKAQEATGKKIDVLGFDCCLMASLEVAYQVRDQASYMVASEMTEGGDGWPYSPIMGPDVLKSVQRTLESKIDLSPKELATMIVDKSGATPAVHTLSAVDLSKVGDIKGPMVELRQAIVESPTSKSVLREIWTDTLRFYGYRDAGDYARMLATDSRITDGNLREKAGAALTAIQSAVVAEDHHGPYGGATGLTLQVHRSTDLSYNNLAFEKDVRWSAAQDRVGKLDEPKGGSVIHDREEER